MHHNTETRVWVDGCYDITHFGHANMLRQAKQLGTKLIVGVHSDEDIIRVKRPPVYDLNERVKMVEAIKWTDEVIKNAPYITTLDTLDAYKCDFGVHGDDKTTINGEDTYHSVKSANRYKEVKRTAGISTTGIINRILRKSSAQRHSESIISQYTGTSPFLQTTRKIYEFVDESLIPKSTDRVVYTAGTFDLFHVGHVDYLVKAKSLGDYLVVGLHEDDPTIESKHSILNSNERMMNLLSCKFVNEVLINAPRKVTDDLMDHFNVSVVCHGRFSPDNSFDCYEIPRMKGKFQHIDSGSDLTTEKVIERIRSHSEQYRTTNRLKEETEIKHQVS